MKLSKKIQALILFGVMGTSILTGCSSKNKTKKKSASHLTPEVSKVNIS